MSATEAGACLGFERLVASTHIVGERRECPKNALGIDPESSADAEVSILHTAQALAHFHLRASIGSAREGIHARPKTALATQHSRNAIAAAAAAAAENMADHRAVDFAATDAGVMDLDAANTGQSPDGEMKASQPHPAQRMTKLWSFLLS